MAVNVSDLPDQTLSNRIESLPPKLRTIKSHPYLNAYTPPLPKPLHFHQLSDQTGQSSAAPHHHHQLSTISLPSQPSEVKNTNPFLDYSPPIQPTFKSAFVNQPPTSTATAFNQQPATNFNSHPTQATVPSVSSVFNQHPQYAQIDKPQPIYLNGNIEQYETTFTYNDLEKNCDSPYNKQQIYINHPVISRPENSKPSSSDNVRSLNKSEQMNGHFGVGQVNGHSGIQTTCKQISQLNHQIESNLNAQKIYSNHSHFAENSSQSTYHGLPIKFVKALKKLFDIFDTTKCGLVRVVDIESRINDEEFDEELDRPQDLIDSLRKVTSPNGLINFSNFCAAINICLLKNQLAKSKQQENYKDNYKSGSVKSRNSDRNDSYLRAQNLDHHQTNGYPLTNGQRFPKQSSINSNSPLENSSYTSTNSSSNSSSRLAKELAKPSSRSNQGSQTLNKLKLRPSSVPVEAFNDDETDYYKNCSDQVRFIGVWKSSRLLIVVGFTSSLKRLGVTTH